MKILLDTDILLDVALNRRKFVEPSSRVLKWAETDGGAAIAWHSIANCAYLLENDGRIFLNLLLTFTDVVPTGAKAAKLALRMPMNDLEDALQASAALQFQADFIITRNLPGYRRSPVPAIDPQQFLKQVS